MGRPFVAACRTRPAPDEWPYTAAVAPAPAVVVEHSEMLRQLLGGRAHQSPVAHRPAHHDDRRTIAQPVEGDGGTVLRTDFLHESSSRVFRCPRLLPTGRRTGARGRRTNRTRFLICSPCACLLGSPIEIRGGNAQP